MERNHDVERIYMRKLREIESAVWILNKERIKHERDINNLRRPYEKSQTPRKYKKSISDRFEAIGTHLMEIVAGMVGYLIVIIALWFLSIFSNFVHKHFMSIVPVITVIFAIIEVAICITIIYREYKEHRDDKKSYEQKVNQYKKEKENIEKQYKKNCALADQKAKELPAIKDELRKALAIRDNLYNVNWIPGSYRNIRVAYYICDMVTTSEITIEEALKYFLLQEANNKLDAILQRVDRIIEQQNQAIIQQAILESQNKELIENNRTMISKMSNIEENTQLCADYARVGAAYLEANAYFGLATYLKY